jgi:hypothetical protein
MIINLLCPNSGVWEVLATGESFLGIHPMTEGRREERE